MPIICTLLLILLVGTVATDDSKGAQDCKSLRTLPSKDLAVFEKIRKSPEGRKLMLDRNCSAKNFHRNWKITDLSMNDRVILVEEELNFAIHVLGNFQDSELSEKLWGPIENLRDIRENLSCARNQLHSHQRSKRLTSWLQKFHRAKDAESPKCLKKYVMVNFFHLMKDLKCTVYKEHCN